MNQSENKKLSKSVWMPVYLRVYECQSTDYLKHHQVNPCCIIKMISMNGVQKDKKLNLTS